MMRIDLSLCNDAQLWELLADIALIMKDRMPDKDNAIIYAIWCKAFTDIRKEIDKRLAIEYEN